MADDLRAELGRLVRQLVAEGDEERREQPIAPVLLDHLGEGARELPVLTESLDDWELPNLQLGLDALLARPGWSADVIGLTGRAKRYEQFSLSDLMTDEPYLPSAWSAGATSTPPSGRVETMACLEFAILLVTSPEGPIALFVRRGESQGMGSPRLALQAIAAGEGVAAALLAGLRALMHEHDVYRGQVLTMKVDAHTGASELIFLERPQLDAAGLILPNGVLDGSRGTCSARPSTATHSSPAGGTSHEGCSLGSPGHRQDTDGPLPRQRADGRDGDHPQRQLARLRRRVRRPREAARAVARRPRGRRSRRAGAHVWPVRLEPRPLRADERDGRDGRGRGRRLGVDDQPTGRARAGTRCTTRAGSTSRSSYRCRTTRRADGCWRSTRAASTFSSRTSRSSSTVRQGVPASFIKELLRKAALAAAEGGARRSPTRTWQGRSTSCLAETSALTRVLLGAGEPGEAAAPDPHGWMTSSADTRRVKGCHGRRRTRPMAARKKKRPLRPRTPSRVKKRTTKKKHARAAHEHPELIGLVLAAFGLFLASLLYLGWEGGVVGEKIEAAFRDVLGSAAYVAPLALAGVGGLMLFRSALLDVRPFRTGLAVTLVGLMVTLGSDHGGFVGELLGGGLAKLLGCTGVAARRRHRAARGRAAALGRVLRRAAPPLAPRRPARGRPAGESGSEPQGRSRAAARARARAAGRRRPRLPGRRLRGPVRAAAAAARPRRRHRRADRALRRPARRGRLRPAGSRAS